VQKIFGLLGGKQVPIASLLGAAGILEFVGVLLIAGLLTRPVAAVLIVEMLVAYVKAHLPRGWVPIQNGGELALLFALAFVFLAAHGAGAFSLDAWLGGRRGAA
jgi:putative oxidoreductase